MSSQNERLEAVKERMAEVMHEKNALVGRLNAMHQEIADEEDPVTKVRRKVEWAAEKERSVEALNRIVASLQRALEKQDGMAEMAPAARSTLWSTASRENTDSGCSLVAARAGLNSFTGNVSGASSAALHLPGASSQSCTDTHASSADASERTTYQDSSYKAGAAEPREKKHWCRSSSLPPRALAVWPLPARLDKDHWGMQPCDCQSGQKGLLGRPASTPVSSKPAGAVTRLSSEGQQVCKSVRKSAWKFSASFLRRVEFKLPWREAGPPNHHDDTVDSDQ